MEVKNEEWRTVPGYEGLYEVSNMGNVRSTRSGKLIKPSLNNSGYSVIHFYDHQNIKAFTIHRLVATVFIPNPCGKRTVNHIDGDKTNNRADNLEWATYSENHKHAYRTGLKAVSDKQRKAASDTGKRTCEMNRRKTPVIKMGLGGETFYESAHEAARDICGDPSPIIRCCKGKKKTYKGCEWKYA